MQKTKNKVIAEEIDETQLKDEADSVEEERVSRAQLKREANAKQALGMELVPLADKQLALFDLPQVLLEAIKDSRKITSHGARRRQMQFIGRLMCDVDPEPIRKILKDLRRGKQVADDHFRKCEMWRDRLLKENEPAIEDFLKACPQADRQCLRAFVRDAQKEAKTGKPPISARELFTYIREIII